MNRVIRVILTLCIMVFVVSGAVSIPLFFRSFYYAEIDKLNLVENTGYSETEIREAYDEMMDYCMGKSEKFGTGKLAWSSEGKSHFDDCRDLFTLDKRLLVGSAMGIGICVAFMIVLSNLNKSMRGGDRLRGGGMARGSASRGNDDLRGGDTFLKDGMRAGSQAGIMMLLLGGALGIIGAKDFDVFFVKFHHTFFPGKDNWIFEPSKDEIIKILPEEFFMNCAILIVSVIVVISVLLIVINWLGARRTK